MTSLSVKKTFGAGVWWTARGGPPRQSRQGARLPPPARQNLHSTIVDVFRVQISPISDELPFFKFCARPLNPDRTLTLMDGMFGPTLHQQLRAPLAGGAIRQLAPGRVAELCSRGRVVKVPGC